MPARVLVSPDLPALAQSAAAHVRAAAAAAVSRRGRFRLALSGGSTPRALYELLAAERGSVDWERADLFFGDERSVPPDHPDSNYRMARETLLEPARVPEANVRRMHGEAPDLVGAARAYEEALTAGAAPPWLDLVLLGMGPDGHTASLFPGTTAVDERNRACVAVEVPRLATRRLTLTLPVLAGATGVAFLIAGGEKAEALRDVLGEADRGRERPAQLVMRQATGAVVVFCDKAAAAMLPASAAGVA
jgi:6-phosphogluconolactonase